MGMDNFDFDIERMNYEYEQRKYQKGGNDNQQFILPNPQVVSPKKNITAPVESKPLAQSTVESVKEVIPEKKEEKPIKKNQKRSNTSTVRKIRNEITPADGTTTNKLEDNYIRPDKMPKSIFKYLYDIFNGEGNNTSRLIAFMMLHAPASVDKSLLLEKDRRDVESILGAYEEREDTYEKLNEKMDKVFSKLNEEKTSLDRIIIALLAFLNNYTGIDGSPRIKDVNDLDFTLNFREWLDRVDIARRTLKEKDGRPIR